MPVESDVESLSDELPEALETVTRLGLRKLARVLRAPVDLTDGNLLRSQVTAALGVVNAQARVDEARMRAKQQGDTLARLLDIIEAERKRRELEQKAAASLPRGRGDEDTPSPPEEAS